MNNRHYGVDLLRILAMLGVCLLHFNSALGLSHIDFTSYPVSRVISSSEHFMGMCSVNIYAMITGYFCINASKLRVAKYVQLWFQVAFYTAGLFLVYYILKNAFHTELAGCSFVSLLYPLPLGSAYWYFAAYTVVFFLAPFLNRGIKALTKSQLQKMLLFCLVLMPVAAVLKPRFGEYVSLDNAGHSAVWLVVMYITGSYTRLYPPRLGKLTIFFMIFVLLSTMQVIVLFNGKNCAGSTYYYPPYVFMSIAIMLLFTQFEIKNHYARRLIAWAAPLSFGVYLIHMHPCVFKNLIHFFASFGEVVNHFWFITLATSILYIVCSLIDWVRMKLFSIAHIKELSQLIENISRKFIDVLQFKLERWF